MVSSASPRRADWVHAAALWRGGTDEALAAGLRPPLSLEGQASCDQVPWGPSSTTGGSTQPCSRVSGAARVGRRRRALGLELEGRQSARWAFPRSL